MNAERVEEVIRALDRGELRVAEPVRDDWQVNPEAQEAILEYFRLQQMEPQEVGPFEYHDKIPLKHDYAKLGVRVVPPAVARYGAFLSPGVVMMPSYVNIGAWVGRGRWSTRGQRSGPEHRSARMCILREASESEESSSRRARAPSSSRTARSSARDRS